MNLDRTLRNILKRLDQHDTASEDQDPNFGSPKEIKESPQQKLSRLQQEALAFRHFLSEVKPLTICSQKYADADIDSPPKQLTYQKTRVSLISTP